MNLDKVFDYASYFNVVLIIALVLLIAAAFLGKSLWKRHSTIDRRAEDELTIILAATLSLFSLLVGFTFSFAINGYQARIQAEEREAAAISQAFQSIVLLDQAQQASAHKILRHYLDHRIEFYKSAEHNGRTQAKDASIDLQAKMWAVVSDYARQEPNSLTMRVLSACSDLYSTQEKAMSSWQRQVPLAAWVLLLVFALCSNFLLGYHIRGIHGKNALIMLLPGLITLTLLMISEIDSPGANIIDVNPKNLELLKHTLTLWGLQ